MAYSISFKASALKQMEKLPKKIARRIIERVELLSADPRPEGSVKLSGGSGFWRIRIGDYRVVYWISDSARLVDVRAVAHRREIYRDL